MFSLIFSLISCSQSKKHIGEWKGTDEKGKVGSLILNESSHVILVMGNQVIGGKDFEIDGIKAECKYEINYKKDPIWLDIVFSKEGAESGRMKGIIRFISDTKMEYRLSFDTSRFEKFDPTDKLNTIVLDKVAK